MNFGNSVYKLFSFPESEKKGVKVYREFLKHVKDYLDS